MNWPSVSAAGILLCWDVVSRARSWSQVSRPKTAGFGVEKPGHIPKKPSGFFWVNPPEKKPPHPKKQTTLNPILVSCSTDNQMLGMILLNCIMILILIPCRKKYHDTDT